jgi:1-acyl-sn-glycerol-3-phosphate acyltransferase
MAADSCLCATVLYHVVESVPASTFRSQMLSFLMAPVLLLGLCGGAVIDGLPRRWVLLGCAIWCLCAAGILGIAEDGESKLLLLALTAVTLGSVVENAARSSFLPAVARDTLWPLSRLTGLTGAGMATGVIVGAMLASPSRPLATIIVLSLAGLLATLFVHFPSDIRRHDSVLRALAKLPAEWIHIARNPQTRNPLLSMLCFVGLIAASLAADIARDPSGALDKYDVLGAAVGVIVGFLLASFQGHPTRVRGLIPFGALLLVAGLTWSALADQLFWPCLLLGAAAGLISVPLHTAYLTALPADRRGTGMALLAALSFCLGIIVIAFVLRTNASPGAILWWLVALAALLAGWTWYFYLRPALEQIMEVLLWPIYRVKGYGPGLEDFPAQGPVLIIANHTAWFDPLWLAKVTPREVTPMMTSAFYDLPVLRFLMEHIVHAIRVPAGTFRREAPELQEGIAVLDRGGCLVIFPEGFVKRRPEQVLHFFAQGAWRILSQRPNTPVVACWIEGGWGSYTSYCGSRPMVDKRLDWWRRINVGVDAPQVLDGELLADHRATRTYLMQACLKARNYLGLKSAAGELPTQENGETGEDED